MKFEKVLKAFSGSPYFELEAVRQIFPDPDAHLKNQLSHWAKQGKIEQLRRGKYLLGDNYRKFTPSAFYVSNYLYRPSYVSLEAALQYYGLIPEAVASVQAVTPKHGREWFNNLGRFKYRSIKQARFWGYRENVLDSIPAQNRFFIAEPEKAVLDMMYLQDGEWPEERIREKRFQALEHINANRLLRYSRKFNSPKLLRGADCFIELYKKKLHL